MTRGNKGGTQRGRWQKAGETGYNSQVEGAEYKKDVLRLLGSHYRAVLQSRKLVGVLRSDKLR